MSANVPTDICFSFKGLKERGGRTGPHKDGWGVAFYENKGVCTFIATEPLTRNEQWHQMQSGESQLFRYGEALA